MIVDRIFFGKFALLTLVWLLSSAASADDACTKGCETAETTCMDMVAHHNGTAQGCVIQLKACKAECTTPPKPLPKVTEVGNSCAAAICSAPHLACYDRHCGCEPGFVACGTKCVDIVNDENSCGACGISCKKGEKCFAGECLDAKQGPPTPKESKAGKRFDVTPGNCSEFESHPVLSLNEGIMFQADAAGGTGQLVSWAKTDSPTNWKISNTVVAAATTNEAKGVSFQPPACGPKGKESQTGCPLIAGGDVWATTSGFSGREYVAARVSWNPLTPPPFDPKLPPHTSSPGIFSVLPSDLKSGNLPKARWALPISEADDGLTVAYDAGGTSLWVAATCGKPTGTSDTHPCTVLFPRCTGKVDSPTCRRAQIGAGSADFVDPMRQAPDNSRANRGHTTVVVNPCTHHALVSFLESGSNNEAFVTVAAINRRGEVVAKWRHSGPFSFGDTQCPDASSHHFANCSVRPLCPDPTATNTNCCDSSDACTPTGSTASIVSRVVPRVQTDVKVWGSGSDARCTVYVGWDAMKGGPGPVRRAATLGSINVTGNASGNENPNAEFKVLTQVHHDGESMDATPVASRFEHALALIYVQRNAAGTTETLRARVSRDGDFANFDDLAVSDKNPNSWFGDSLSELLGGLPGGKILATWPELTSSSCMTIDGALITVGSEAGHDEPEPPTPPVIPRADPELWKSIPPDGHP